MAVKRRSSKEEPLNLIPVMNLVTILIPFLLMAAEFVSLAVIDSTLPAIGEPQTVTEPPDPDEEPPLQLSLGITNRGIHILGADKALFPDGAPELAEGEEREPTVPCLNDGVCATVDDYNWDELFQKLVQIKDVYADNEGAENVIIVPDTSIRYEVIVKAMDIAREDRENKDNDGRPRTLFPFVVIAGGAM